MKALRDEQERQENPTLARGPCKHWSERVPDSEMKHMLTMAWISNLNTWALEWPYLTKQDALCECARCKGQR